MASIYSEIKSIYEKHFDTDDQLIWEGKSDFKSMDQSDPEVAELTALEELVESRGETNPYLLTLYRKLTEGDKEEATSEDTITGFEELQAQVGDLDVSVDEEELEADAPEEEQLGKNEETFANKYPDVDQKETLKKCYVTWLDSMTNKPFFKTVASFYDLAKMNQLNFVDRAFLWKFLKAISSCITHLLIEGEQREESVCLVDTYFDSLNDCLLSTIHAKSKDDVIQSFLYMVSFLGLNRDVHGEVETLDTGNDENTTNKDEAGSIGEF